MIYLIDDKKQRQENDYNWGSERFQKYNQFIKPIHTLAELQEKAQEVFKKGNIILYHESFLDKTDLNTRASVKRDKIDEFTTANNSYLVFFSGSKNTRDISGNIANIPVSLLYANLEEFTKKFAENDINLNYLLFGKSPNIEVELSERLKNVLIETFNEEPANINGETLFIRSAKNNIVNAVEGSIEKTIFGNVSDESFSEKITQWLNEKVYDNIFIPLCFGPVLSDFEGLRLATHIRCTTTRNQTARIFIYGFVGLNHLITETFFNILKTKNVHLVDFSKKAFQTDGNKAYEELTLDEVSVEISKLKLEPPHNYFDNHSVANEWAIYRWANAIGVYDGDLARILEKANNDLYFKYLQTIFPIKNFKGFQKENLKIDNIENTRVLYIDDDADKGWYDIFCTILTEINGVSDFYYLCEEFKNKTRDEIIQLSLDEIKLRDSDIVILDFRLHEEDFSEREIKHITGLRLANEIKNINPGIQVIMFSATNKVWNFQALLNVGVDGFIVKESPENSVDLAFTNMTIRSFIQTLRTAGKKVYLKTVWFLLNELKKLTTKYDTDFSVAFKLLNDSIDNEKYKNYAYLQLFQIIEKFISDTEVFINNPTGQNFVIGKEGTELLVFDYLGKENNIPTYKSAITFSGGNYKKKRDNRLSRRLDTNVIMSALLIFRYGLSTSGEKNWTDVYSTRNSKAAHPERGTVDRQELITLIDFLKFIFDERNINKKNENDALQKPTFEEQMEKLKGKFMN